MVVSAASPLRRATFQIQTPEAKVDLVEVPLSRHLNRVLYTMVTFEWVALEDEVAMEAQVATVALVATELAEPVERSSYLHPFWIPAMHRMMPVVSLLTLKAAMVVLAPQVGELREGKTAA